MNNTCISSSVSLRCRGPLSISFNDYSGCLDDGFDRNSLLHSSSFSSLPCCSCCANSLYNSGPVTSSGYLYGLRQSNLIQWSPHKRLILNGLDRFSYGRVPICEVDASFFREKDYIFKERRVGGKGRKIGNGRYRTMVFEEKCEWYSSSDGCDGGVDEVEVMLSLLTGEVSDECKNTGERRGQSYKKIEVVKRGNNRDNNVRRRKKIVDSGVLESQSEFEYESKIIGSKEGEMRRKEENRREKERGVILRRENVKVKREDERANPMREVSCEMAKEEERMNLFIGNQRERSRLEERENLSTRQDHKQRLRKDGSSCSSYYSVTSGDSEINNEIQREQDGFEEEISGGYLGESGKSEGILSHEVKEEMQGHENYAREKGVILKKESAQAGFSGASSSVAYDWRKQSEKKLSDSSVQEIKSGEELAQKQLRYGEVNQRNSRKTVNFDEKIRERNDRMIESETTMRSKQSNEMLETHATDVKTYSTTGKSYRKGDESSYTNQSSVQKESDYNMAQGQISNKEDYKNSGNFNEASKLQEVDIRGTSTAVRQSGIRIKSEEDYSNTTLSTLSNNEEQRHQSSQTSRLLDSREKYQQLTDDVDSGRTSTLRRGSDARMKRHEINSSSSYKSHHKLRDQRSEMIRKHITTQETSNASQETVDLSITPHDNTNVLVVDHGRKRTGVVMEPPSQIAVRGSIHVDTASVSATEEGAGERLDGSFTATSHKHTLDRSEGFHYQSSHDARRDDVGQTSKFISDEDRVASADLLQKSSTHYVGEFVQKVRNEISSSELHEVKKTHEVKSLLEDEQQSKAYLSSYNSQVSQSKEQNSRSSSRSSATKGPSDQVCDVPEPSNQEPPEAEAIGTETTTEVDVRRTGKSLWHIIGDIVRLRWHSRSESHSSAAKSGAKNSSNLSTSSETWFSGHDPDETIDLSTKSDRISLVEESTSIDCQQEGIISSASQGEASNSSTSQGDLKQRGAGSLQSSVVLEKDSLVKEISFLSSGATSDVKESSVLLPSVGLKISPVDKISKARGGQGSSSDTILQIDQPFPTTVKSRLDGKDEELKRKKLGRSDHVAKDRFDEWEEAYRLENEQRRIDEMFMREALLEAKKAADSWEVPVGAVLVRDGNIIARGYNLVEELRDSTAHAEINCIRGASNVLRTWRLSDTTLYVTLEPCPMCAGAILQARIDTVVWGAPNKLLGADGSWIRLFPNGEGENVVESSDKPPAPVHPFHPKIEVRRRVLAAECADTMQHFFQLRRRKDQKPEPTTPLVSRLPISHHPSKFLTKMHHAFHIMFCL